MSKICIVEDDKDICKELKELLSNSGYEVEIIKDFNAVVQSILRHDPELVLLDINIPCVNGEIVLKELRKNSDVPVIMVTSREAEADEVLSMSYGADDYITKPYNPTILLLRINALLRRAEGRSSVIRYKELELNPLKGVVKYDGGNSEILLTKNEMIILTHLISKRDCIVSRDELITELWNNEEYVNDNTLTVNISRLRTKLKDIGYPDVIDTRKGQGYILT